LGKIGESSFESHKANLGEKKKKKKKKKKKRPTCH
jgi:hypothetical protein